MAAPPRRGLGGLGASKRTANIPTHREQFLQQDPAPGRGGRRLSGFGGQVFRELTGGRYITLRRSDLSKLRGGWTDQCTETDPGAVQPARDGRVRHGYPISVSPQARSLAAPDDQSHAVRPPPQDGPRGLPHHVSREAAVFEVMLTRGYSGTRAGAFIIPIPGVIARAMKRRPRCGPRPNGRAQRCPCPPALVRGTS